MVGDSHAQQLTGALIPIAAEQGWQLTTIIRGACPFSTASEAVPGEAVCDPAFCPAEIGNVLVHLDDNHLTAGYSTSMAPLLHDQVTAAVD